MLRKNMTDTERKLWSKLRSNQLGVKFRRQVPFGPYIADFLSIEVKLVIEIDGCQHYQYNAMMKDKIRDQYFRKEGFTVLRFNNSEVFENIDDVMETIFDYLFDRNNK
jgi:very-short-patch-repair endonuclease